MTFVYQHLQGNSLDSIFKAHEGMLVPGLVFIFDLPAEVAIQRMNTGRFVKESERNEKFEKIEFLSKARKGFLDIPKLFPNEEIVVINAEKDVDEIFATIKKHLVKVVKVD